MQNDLLSISLQAAVPLWAEKLQSDSWEVLQNKIKEASTVISEHGDEILFKSKKKGETAKYFNIMAEAIAILSFCPGGITIFGSHYEYAHPAFKTPKKLKRG
jgi:hypothetical protein